MERPEVIKATELNSTIAALTDQSVGTCPHEDAWEAATMPIAETLTWIELSPNPALLTYGIEPTLLCSPPGCGEIVTQRSVRTLRGDGFRTFGRDANLTAYVITPCSISCGKFCATQLSNPEAFDQPFDQLAGHLIAHYSTFHFSRVWVG